MGARGARGARMLGTRLVRANILQIDTLQNLKSVRYQNFHLSAILVRFAQYGPKYVL